MKPKKEHLPPSPLKRHFDQLTVIDEVLYRELAIDDRKIRQLVLPAKHVHMVQEALHDEMGHPGRDRTSSLVRDRFYWSSISNELIQHCGRCLKRKKEPHRTPIKNITL